MANPRSRSRRPTLRTVGGCVLIAGSLVLLSGGRATDPPTLVTDSLAADEPQVTLAFGGDILLGQDMNTYVKKHGANAPLGDVPEIGQADVAVANLESVVAPGADAVDTGRVGDSYFLGRPETLDLLVASGIDVVATANNHARDYGTAALAAEDRLLTEMGMPHPGIGRTPAEACAPVYIAPRNLRIALFAINATDPAYATGDGGFGTCHLPVSDRSAWERTFGPAIADARRRADIVLVMPHVRASFRNSPDPADQAIARLLIDLGADAVLAKGAHAVQGIELRGGRPILHNAGSLLFNFPELDETALFVLRLSPAGVVGIQTVPLIAELNRTRRATPVEGGAILASIDAWSAALGTPLISGSLSLAPPPRDPPTVQPDRLARLNPGPAPGPVSEPPAVCTAAAVPADAELAPEAVGPLRLVGAQTERDRFEGAALIWLTTFWQIDAPTTSDLSIAPRAVPLSGAPWLGIHEPCDWAWPTSRWEPGLIYRDRYGLRPPPDVGRLGGIPALLSMTSYGPLAISIEVQHERLVVAESGTLRTVQFLPTGWTRLVAAVLVALAGLAVVGFVVLRLRWKRRPG